jgi:tight adherence protein B
MAVLLALLTGVAAAGAVFALAGPVTSRIARLGIASPRAHPVPVVRLRAPAWLDRLLAARRLERVRAQLPEGLTGLSTSVRAGLSLPQAIQSAGTQMADPLGAEFRTMGAATALGATLEQALDAFEARTPLPEVRLLVAALKLARTTGGSLAPLLDRLTATVREREKLRGQVAVLTAQGRLSGWVVGSMPVVLLGVMGLVDPAFVRPLLVTPVGWALLAAAVVLEGLGIFMIRAIVRVEP